MQHELPKASIPRQKEKALKMEAKKSQEWIQDEDSPNIKKALHQTSHGNHKALAFIKEQL